MACPPVNQFPSQTRFPSATRVEDLFISFDESIRKYTIAEINLYNKLILNISFFLIFRFVLQLINVI